ncbi:MAG: hypothetical protein ACLPTZ_30685 [Beijerinckiaceae bacterium]
MLGGEALQSGFHFVLNVVLVHVLSARDFGIFAIVMVIGGLSLTYVRGLTAMPASIWIGRSLTRGAADAYDVMFGSGAVLLSVLAAIGVDALLHVWSGAYAHAGGCFVGLWALRSHLRTTFFARGRQNAVIISDLAFILSGATMAAAWGVGTSGAASADILQSALVALAAANAIGIAAMLILSRRPFRLSCKQQLWRRYARLWRQLGWSFLSTTVTNLQGQAVALLVTSFGGPTAYAPIAATLLLFVPLRIATTPLVNLLQPKLSAELARGEARKVWLQVKVWSVITGVVGLVYGAAMIAMLPRINFHALEGIPVHLIGFFAWAIYTMTMLYVMPRIVLEVMMAFNTLALITAIAAATGTALIVCILFVAPPAWALAGGAVSEMVVLVMSWVVVYRRLHTPVSDAESEALDSMHKSHLAAGSVASRTKGEAA